MGNAVPEVVHAERTGNSGSQHTGLELQQEGCRCSGMDSLPLQACPGRQGPVTHVQWHMSITPPPELLPA
jgi:hypothetical protein